MSEANKNVRTIESMFKTLKLFHEQLNKLPTREQNIIYSGFNGTMDAMLEVQRLAYAKRVEVRKEYVYEI